VAFVEDLRKRLSGDVEFVPHDAENVDMILAVEGCQHACADLSSFKDCEIFIIKAPEDAERFIQYWIICSFGPG